MVGILLPKDLHTHIPKRDRGGRERDKDAFQGMEYKDEACNRNQNAYMVDVLSLRSLQASDEGSR